MDVHTYSGRYSQPRPRSGFMEDLLAAGSGLLSPTPTATDYTTDTGWTATRAAGLLAVLLSAWDMPYTAIQRWAEVNGIAGWVPSVSSLKDSESANTLIGADGNINFLNDYPKPVDWADRWALWTAGNLDVTIPPAPSVIAPTAPTDSPVAVPVVTTAAPSDAQKSMYRAILGALAFSLFG